MRATSLKIVMRRLRQTTFRAGAGPKDGELLECFLTRRDPSAFEALVHRHGSMVLGVCRRILRNEADAEDAFQATFLVLVRKANSIRPRCMVGNWLYGVARNSALKAKAMNRKRQAKEWEAGNRPGTPGASQISQELLDLLDEELASLPDKYRVPIVLCDLEGKPLKEAARQLDWPQGTVATRLTRGRAMLGRRLARHGVALPAGALGVALLQGAALANVPAPLLASTVQSAALLASGEAAAILVSKNITSLMEGVLKMLLLSKLKTGAALLLIATMIACLGFSSLQPAGATFPAREDQEQSRRSSTPSQPPDGGGAEPGQVKGDAVQREEPEKPAPAQPIVVDPVQKTGKIVRTLKKQANIHFEDSVKAIALSPDGSRVAVALAEFITLRDVPSGRELARLNEPSCVGLEFSPDGKLLATSHDAPVNVMIWDASSGKLIARHSAEGALNGPSVSRTTGAMAWSGDGKVLATVKGGGSTIILWDVRAMITNSADVMWRSIPPHNGTVRSLAFARTGNILAATSNNGAFKLWDSSTGKELRAFGGHAADVLSFSPDGKTIASASQDGTIRLWDASSAREWRLLQGHKGPVIALSFSPDGQTLASAGRTDRIVALWDIPTGRNIAKLKQNRTPVATVAFSKDGSLLLCGDECDVRFWQVIGDNVIAGGATNVVLRSATKDDSNLAKRLVSAAGELAKTNKSDTELIEALYLVTLQRLPTDVEKISVPKYMKGVRNREQGVRDIVWALVNSREFLQLHGLDRSAAATLEFTSMVSKAMGK